MRLRGKKILSFALAAVMAATFPVMDTRVQAAGTDADYTVTVKGSDVVAAASNINGLTYKGFGMLNGNSTSNLLLDYKYENPEKYNEMMQYLFGGKYPLFTHIKMELGNDGNNSTGAEACTMRYENEEADASRSPGFVMAADAKKINPDVKISILRWEVPKWVAAKNTNSNSGKLSSGACYEAAYKWYRETIFDAYEKYGYVVDFVDPDKNETTVPDTAFIKWFSNRVKSETAFPSYMDAKAQAAYKSIRIIASDENKSLQIVPKMREDKDLYDAVDIIGFHYRTNATDDYVKMADEDDKEVWYSEGCATFGYSELQKNKTSAYSGGGYENDPAYGVGTFGGFQGPLALVDSFITAFSSSRRTHYMFQPAIGSFYEGIQYGHKELLSARDPWSGYIHYDPALYMLEHFAKFAKTGWEDSQPDTNDIWRVITSATGAAFAGSDKEHTTAGIDGKAGYMTLASPDKKDFSVVIVNNTRNEKSFLIDEQDMAISSDNLNLWLTDTDSYLQNTGTVARGVNGWYLTVPPYSVSTATTLDTVPERAPVDNIHNEDRTVLDTDKTGHVNGVTTDNVLYADDFEYREEPANYLKERGNEPRYMLDAHGAWVVENGRLKQELANSVDQWNGGDPSTIVGDFRWMDYMTSVDVEIPNASSSVWARLTTRAQTGMNWDNSGYTLEMNGSGTWKLYRIGTVVKEGTVASNPAGKYNVRIVAFGDTIRVLIDNRTVATYQDAAPILSGRVKLSSTWNQVYFDNLLVETIDGGIPYALSMVDGQDDSVNYEGNWTIKNPGGGSADDWYRTLSVTSTANASFNFKVKGCGFAILGANDGTAKLDVTVDGELKEENAATVASPSRGETYILSDLPNGEHRVEVVVKSGKLQIDALYGLGERRAANDNVVLSVKTEIPSIPVLLTGDISTVVNDLPKQVDVETINGETVQKDVIWNTSASQFDGTEFRASSITGTVWNCLTPWGAPLTVTVPVERVIPSDTVYFIDSVDNPPSLSSTEPYDEVKGKLGDKLLNEKYDQLKTDGNTWGQVDTGGKAKGYNNDTTDMTATGLYGKEDKEGITLSYAVTLPAGKYKLLSGHREWWGNARNMAASINFAGKKQSETSISLGGNSDYINTASFTLDSEQLVTYTMTSKNGQAPVISWLAVIGDNKAAHEHEYTHIMDNGDGTHTMVCKDGDDTKKEAHSFEYKDNGDGKHTATCKVCKYSETEDHTVKCKESSNGRHEFYCENCNYSKMENHSLKYTDNKNGKHTESCKTCGYSKTEAHTYQNGVCIKCRAVKGETVVRLSTPAISSITNESKGIKISWKKISNAKGYYVYRKTGKGKLQKVGTIMKADTTSFTDTSVKKKNGTSYQYQICAYSGNSYSKYSAAKTMIRLTANKLTSVKNVKGKKIQVKWAKNTKCGGYEIWYSTSKKFSGAKKVKVSGAKKTTTTIKGLKKNKTYYVRIRCYKKSGKATYVSGWSSSKKVKIKK